MSPISPQIFDKYTVSRGENNYIVKKMESSGKESVCNEEEANKVLTTDYLSGSIAFTRDSKHVGWLHKCIYLMQKIHAWAIGSQFVDHNLCHGYIIMGPATKEELNPLDKKAIETKFPFKIGHAVFPGIQISTRDYLIDSEVTEYIVYRPRNDNVRKIVLDWTEKTSYNKKEKNKGPQKKADFSIWDLCLATFKNRKHKVCGRQKIQKEITKRTSYAIADYLLNNQILNQRDQPKALLCSGYTAYILQVALIIEKIYEKVSKDELRTFIKDTNRHQLANKIYQAFTESLNDNVSNAFHEIYWSNKLARYDARYAMSCYMGKILDKQSMESTKHNEPYFVDYISKPPSSLKKFVRWYKKDGLLPENIKKIIAYVTAIIFFPLILLFMKMNKIARQLNMDKMEKAAPHLAPLSIEDLKEEMIDDKHIYSYYFDYIIENDKIWYRNRYRNDLQWKNIVFSGEKNNRIPVKIEIIRNGELRITDNKGQKYVRQVFEFAKGFKQIEKQKRHIPEGLFEVNRKDKDTSLLVDKHNLGI